MPLAILALYIPQLFIVQSKRMTEWEERVKQTEWGREGMLQREDNVIDTVGNGQKGDRGRGRGIKLSCGCYQVKPHTTGCRHGDTMVTTRCSTRKEHDLAYVKELPVCVFLPHYFCLRLSHSESFSGIILLKGLFYIQTASWCNNLHSLFGQSPTNILQIPALWSVSHLYSAFCISAGNRCYLTHTSQNICVLWVYSA